jgi:hypothetical protein
MPLLCELGWHRADPLARWNHGYYFSKCGRCGRDLVRTAFAGWQVPQGFKVVWQAQPPAGVEDVQLVPEREAPVASTFVEIHSFDDGNATEPPAAPVTSEEQGEAPPQDMAVEVEELAGTPSEAADEISDLKPPAEAEVEEAELPFDAPDAIEEQFAIEESSLAQETASQPGGSPITDEPASASSGLVDGPEAGAVELPIQEVLRQLGEGQVPEREAAESAGEAAPEPPLVVDPAPALPPRIRRGAIPDFMNDDPGEDLLESMSEPPRRELRAIAYEDDADFDDDPEDRDHRADHEAGEKSAALSSSDGTEPAVVAMAPAVGARSVARQKILGERDPSSSSSRRGGEGDPNAGSRRAKAAATIAASFGVVMLAAALTARPDMRASQVTEQPGVAADQAVQPLPSRESQTAQAKLASDSKAKAEAEAKGFVTASLLNCRSSPAEEAKPVRRLRRGEPVQVLAMEPAWASVSHKGRQCWASSRYISEQEPL